MRIIGDGGHAKVIKDYWRNWWQDLDKAFVAVGDNAARKREAERTQGPFAILLHRGAVISDSATIGDGTVVMAGAIIAASVVIGKHCIVNHNAVVDHDCVLGDYVHVAPGAHLCGHVEVGEGSLVGVGVGIAPMCKIPAWTLVKARKLEIVPMIPPEQDYGLIAGRG